MGGWFSSVVRCNICTSEEVSVYPAAADEEALECANCGAMDCRVIKRITRDGVFDVPEPEPDWA